MAVDERVDPRLTAHKQIGTPASLLQPVETMLSEQARVREQRFVGPKEAAELGRIQDAAVDALVGSVNRSVDEIERSSAKELSELDHALKSEASIFPAKGQYETSAEYGEKLQRSLLSETHKARQAVFTQIDGQIIAEADDPTTIERILADALAVGDVESVRRLGALAELRLARLSRVEARRNPNAHGAGPVFRVFTQVQSQMRAWRDQQAATSPSVRRQRIVEARDSRIADVRRSADRIVESFEMQNQFRHARRKAEVAAMTK